VDFVSHGGQKITFGVFLVTLSAYILSLGLNLNSVLTVTIKAFI